MLWEKREQNYHLRHGKGSNINSKWRSNRLQTRWDAFWTLCIFVFAFSLPFSASSLTCDTKTEKNCQIDGKLLKFCVNVKFILHLSSNPFSILFKSLNGYCILMSWNNFVLCQLCAHGENIEMIFLQWLNEQKLS